MAMTEKKAGIPAGGTVCLLFTDFEDSTGLLQTLGDQEARKLWRSYLAILRGAAAQMGGQEVKSLGDGLMVAFGSVRDALKSALEMQIAVYRRNLTSTDANRLQLRIGLHVGEPIQEEGDYFGSSVVVARRLCDSAKGGQILVSEAVRSVALSHGSFDFVDCGLSELKGFPTRCHIYELRWQKEDAPAALASATLGRKTPFVGRNEDLQTLRQLLQQTSKGTGCLVLIAGEPGVGKTRIARELATEARELGFLCLTGHCREVGGKVPHAPFIEVMQSAARIVGPRTLAEVVGDLAPELAKMMPELRRVLVDIPAPPELPPEQERRYLFNCVRECTARACKVQPQFIILEDIQWADESTVLLLHHIAASLAEMPVMIVGTYRDVELDYDHPFTRAMEDFVRNHVVHRLTLRRLSKRDVGLMLRSRSGHAPPAEVLNRIFEQTEGNPLFVEEVFEQLVREAVLFDADGRWRRNLSNDKWRVPESIRLLIGRRLDRVGKDCQRALGAAALIGRDFGIELLREVLDMDANKLVDIIDKAEHEQLVSSVIGGHEAHLVFSHDLVRQTLIQGLSLPRRQRLHTQIAEGMEGLYANSIELHATELAHHFYQAGAFTDFSKTALYLQISGERALASAAFEQALKDFERALSLQPFENEEMLADLHCGRGQALRSLGRLDEAVEAWRESLDIWEKLGKIEKVGSRCASISSDLLGAQRVTEAYEMAERGLAVLGDRLNEAHCMLLAASGFIACYFPGVEYDNAREPFDQALDMAAKLGDENLMGPILGRKGALHHMYWQGAEEADVGLKAAEILRSTGDLYAVALALTYAQCGLLRIGQFEKSSEVGGEAKSLAERTGSLAVGWFAGSLEEKRNVLATGDLSRFENQTVSQIKSKEKDDASWIAYDYVSLGMAQFWLGRWKEARTNFEKGVESEIPGMTAGHCLAAHLLFLAYEKDKSAALPVFEQKRESLPRAGKPNPLDAWALLDATIEGLAMLGEWDEVAGLYPLALDALATGNVVRPHFAGSVHTIAGIAATAAEKWEEAEKHFENAIRLAHSVPLRIDQPEARRWYARMLMRRGASKDRTRAQNLLNETITMYRGIGMPRHVEVTKQMFAGL